MSERGQSHVFVFIQNEESTQRRKNKFMMSVRMMLITIIDVIGINTVLFSSLKRISKGNLPNQFTSHGAQLIINPAAIKIMPNVISNFPSSMFYTFVVFSIDCRILVEMNFSRFYRIAFTQKITVSQFACYTRTIAVELHECIFIFNHIFSFATFTTRR